VERVLEVVVFVHVDPLRANPERHSGVAGLVSVLTQLVPMSVNPDEHE